MSVAFGSDWLAYNIFFLSLTLLLFFFFLWTLTKLATSPLFVGVSGWNLVGVFYWFDVYASTLWAFFFHCFQRSRKKEKNAEISKRYLRSDPAQIRPVRSIWRSVRFYVISDVLLSPPPFSIGSEKLLLKSNLETIRKFDLFGFLISLLVRRSRDLEVDIHSPWKFFSSDLHEIWYTDSAWGALYEYVIIFGIQGQGQGHRPPEVGKFTVLKIYLLRDSWSDFKNRWCKLIFNPIKTFQGYGFSISFFLVCRPYLVTYFDLESFWCPIFMKFGLWVVLDESYTNV